LKPLLQKKKQANKNERFLNYKKAKLNGFAFFLSPGARNKEQETRNKKQGTRNREQETREKIRGDEKTGSAVSNDACSLSLVPRSFPWWKKISTR
jgi:hypothetical protein